MGRIWEQGEGKANSFLSLCKSPARSEEGHRGPPRDAGALLGGGDQMETGGCSRAGGEMSTGGWQGSGDAVAMSCCTICSPAAAWARLRVGSLHSTALLRNKNPAFVGDVGAPISAFNCLVFSRRLRTPSKGTQMQSPGALLPPFTGREIEGTKRNNEQRWWAGVPRVSPHSRPALRVASAFPSADGGGQASQKAKQKAGPHPTIALKYGRARIPFAGVGRMKKVQFEKLQLLCWSGRGGKHSEAENRSDVVLRAGAVVSKHRDPARGNAFHFPL